MEPVLPIGIHTFVWNDQEVYFPQVYGIKHREWEEEINLAIVEHVNQLIDQQIGIMPSSLEEMIGTYEIKNNQREVLSLTLTNYAYHEHAAHGMTYIDSLTFDMKKEQLCTLSILFRQGSPYVERISQIIAKQIQAREIPIINDFNGIAPDQSFYIADKCLVIYFQLYDLTPYVYGFPMFPISVYELQDIIDEEGPLGRMAENN